MHFVKLIEKKLSNCMVNVKNVNRRRLFHSGEIVFRLQSRRRKGKKKRKNSVASIKNKGRFITFAEDRNRAFLRHLVGRRRP